MLRMRITSAKMSVHVPHPSVFTCVAIGCSPAHELQLAYHGAQSFVPLRDDGEHDKRKNPSHALQNCAASPYSLPPGLNGPEWLAQYVRSEPRERDHHD